jgi:hypothetical protein
MNLPELKKALMLVLFGCILVPQALRAEFGSSLKTLPAHDPAPAALDRAGQPDFYLTGGGSNPVDRVSVRRAVLYSFLLPGLGDYYLGRTGRARLFWLAEATIWTSFIVFETQGYLRENGYKDYALAYAGISGTNHSDDYYRIISQFNSSDDYEASIKQDGRYELYPNDNYWNLEQYYLTERISDFESWAWAGVDKRRAFWDIRQGSRLARRRALYAAAAGLANRLVSSLMTFKTARDLRVDEEVSSRGRYYLEFGSPSARFGEPFSPGVAVVRTF